MRADNIIGCVLGALPYGSDVLVERKGSWITVRCDITATQRTEAVNWVVENFGHLGVERLPPCSNSAAGSVRLDGIRVFLKPMPRQVDGCANDGGNETMFGKNLKAAIKRSDVEHPSVVFTVSGKIKAVIPRVSSVRRVSRSKTRGVADFTLRSASEKKTYPISLKKSSAVHYSVSADLYEPVKIVMDGLLRDGEITIEKDDDGEPYIVESAVAFPVSRAVAQDCVFGGMGRDGIVVWGDFTHELKSILQFQSSSTGQIFVQPDSVCRDIDEFFDQGHEIFAMVRRAKGRTYGSEQFYNGLRLVTCSRDRLVGNYTIFEDIVI